MNSSIILFLNMMKSDIKKHIYDNEGISYSTTDNSKDGLLTGKTISRSEIVNLASFKLMNQEERGVVDEILNSMKQGGQERGKKMIKQIDGVMPYMYPSSEETFEFKDAA